MSIMNLNYAHHIFIDNINDNLDSWSFKFIINTYVLVALSFTITCLNKDICNTKD